MVVIIRILLFIVICSGIYWCISVWFHPYRKLNKAIEQKRSLIMDNSNNVHRNILLVYRGVLFEAEKYMGTTEKAFEIVNIFVWPRNDEELVGLKRSDFKKIMAMIQETYPHAEVTWKSPVRELLNNSEKP